MISASCCFRTFFRLDSGCRVSVLPSDSLVISPPQNPMVCVCILQECQVTAELAAARQMLGRTLICTHGWRKRARHLSLSVISNMIVEFTLCSFPHAFLCRLSHLCCSTPSSLCHSPHPSRECCSQLCGYEFWILGGGGWGEDVSLGECLAFCFLWTGVSQAA